MKLVKPSSKIFYWRYFFCGSFVLLCLVFVMFLSLFIAVLWSPEGKGPTERERERERQTDRQSERDRQRQKESCTCNKDHRKLQGPDCDHIHSLLPRL